MDVSNRNLFLAIETELDELLAMERDLAETRRKIAEATGRYRCNGGKLSTPQLAAYRQSLAKLRNEYGVMADRLATMRVISLELQSA